MNRRILYVQLSECVMVNIPLSVLFIALFKEATTVFTVIEVVLLLLPLLFHCQQARVLIS